MQAKYDKSSINSLSAKKFEKDSSTKKDARRQIPVTTSRKLMAATNAYTANPTGSFSQIPITNLELDLGNAATDP
jgi:hypothetical protein